MSSGAGRLASRRGQRLASRSRHGRRCWVCPWVWVGIQGWSSAQGNRRDTCGLGLWIRPMDQAFGDRSPKQVLWGVGVCVTICWVGPGLGLSKPLSGAFRRKQRQF